jgi:Domain of unknown function (DUF1996)
MRRWFIPLCLTVGAAASVIAAHVASAAPDKVEGAVSPEMEAASARGGYGAGYFAVVCGFSHRNRDDAIVFARQPGRSHEHTYFGNRSTDAFSTPASLREDGRTTCRLRADTAAYWVPTLLVDGRAVEPLAMVAFYVRRTSDQVDAFPAGLKIVAGDASARSAQSRRVTSWSCAVRGSERSSTIPTCPGARFGGLRLHVNFPDCWDGERLDSPNHRSHMAYSSDGACPRSHPVELPALSQVVYYGVSGGPTSELSSGGDFSGHADFVNAWHQPTLERLVDRYLGRSGFGFGRGFGKRR